MKDFIRFFILDYIEYGRKTYPYLFIISLILFFLDIISVIFGRSNEWIILAICLYTLFFGGIYISYITGRYKEIKKDYGE